MKNGRGWQWFANESSRIHGSWRSWKLGRAIHSGNFFLSSDRWLRVVDRIDDLWNRIRGKVKNELTIAFLKSTLPIFLLPIIELKRRVDRIFGSWFELMKFNRTIHRNWNEWIFLWQWTYISVIHLRDLMEMRLNDDSKKKIQTSNSIYSNDKSDRSWVIFLFICEKKEPKEPWRSWNQRS